MAHRFGDKALSGKFVRYGTPRRGLSTMIRLIWNLSVRTRLLLRAWMPTNILLDAIRTRACLPYVRSQVRIVKITSAAR